MIKKVFQGSFYLVLVQVVTKGFSFVFTIFLANLLGVEQFGLYILALSYFSLVSAIADLGISRYLIREVAKDQVLITKLVSNIVLMRLGLLSAVFLVFSGCVFLFDPDILRAQLITIALAAIIPQALGLTFDSVFIALQRFSYSALGLLVLSISNIIFGYLLVAYGFGVQGAILGFVIGQIIYGLFLFVLLLRMKIPIIGDTEFLKMKHIFWASLPYGILSIIGFVSFRLDTFVLSYFRGNYEIGIYGAAYKFLDAVMFIPLAVATVVFPMLSELHKSDHTSIRKFITQNLLYMGVFGCLLFLGFVLVLPFVIAILLPEYQESIPTIQILSFALPLLFVHIPMGQVILATDKYFKQITIIYLLLMLLNLSLAVIFIPKYGYLGAAWLTVFSEFMTFGSFYLFLEMRVLKGR